MVIKTAKDEIQQYLRDQANLVGDCDKVIIVENSFEVSEILVEANLLNIPVTVCGNHTSLTGASLPSTGWVISTEKLNRIIEINIEECYVDLEPGVTLKDLQLALKEHNLFFPPDPTEDSCFVGGMISTNASGARSFKYGAVREFVEQLEITLPQGQTVLLRRGNPIDGRQFTLNINDGKAIDFKIPESYILPEVKNNVGYYLKEKMDPLDLFIGAEGTLAIITRLRLKLAAIPVHCISLVVFFDDLDVSFDFLDKVRQESRSAAIGNEVKIAARVIEFYDQQALNLLRTKFADIPKEAKAAYWIEQECNNGQEYNELLDLWETFLSNFISKLENIWFGADESDRLKIVGMRHYLPIIINDLIASKGTTKLGTDIAIPDSKFKDFYKMAIRQVEAEEIEYVAFGHFGNSHLHLNMLPSNLSQMDEGKKIYDSLCLEAIKRGGTFSAEHGMGKLKKKYLIYMFGDSNVQFMKSVKRHFDPNGILGKDNLFEN